MTISSYLQTLTEGLDKQDLNRLSPEWVIGWAFGRDQTFTRILDCVRDSNTPQDFVINDTILGGLSHELTGYSARTRRARARRLVEKMEKLGLVKRTVHARTCLSCNGAKVTPYGSTCWRCRGNGTTDYTVIERK